MQPKLDMKHCILIMMIAISSTITAKPIVIFAASSTREIVEYTVKEIGQKAIYPVINFDSSGRLARQILLGAEPDLFISASREWKDYIMTKKKITINNSFEFVRNSLVLVCSKRTKKNIELKNENIETIIQLFEPFKYFSIGNPSCVPAGKYAKESLVYYNLYKKLKSKLIPAKNVRQALFNIEKGICPIGIIYKSDAIISDKADIIYTVPDISHSEIQYYIIKLKHNKMTHEFIKTINTPEFKKFAFCKGFK